MGAIAEAMMRFAQPLIDEVDGSPESLQRAFSLSQLCWNMALMPEGERDQLLADMQLSLKMDDEEFQVFTRDLVMPMIRRHQEMFPGMHQRGAPDRRHALEAQPTPTSAPLRPAKKYAGTGRNERCPCGSGKKYKVCCGR